MIEAVFISDLHLHPDDQVIQERFNQFIEWANGYVKTVYILGDFFHVWAGDDAMDAWSEAIAQQLLSIKQQGVQVYYMHGNRDFLLGKAFAHRAGLIFLKEPAIIQLNQEKVLLVHGDRYCTKDKSHQRFRLFTRNKLFSTLFLKLPFSYRDRLVNQVRQHSQMNQGKTTEEMDVVADSVIQHMLYFKVSTLIHGHTHKPGITTYEEYTQKLKRYVLSDWDDTPQLLCYDNTKGIYFIHI
ncbi:MAG: UDP-2,3-diacylglucosamine diphosphatase [Legionella sp.]